MMPLSICEYWEKQRKTKHMKKLHQFFGVGKEKKRKRRKRQKQRKWQSRQTGGYWGAEPPQFRPWDC